MNNNLNKPGNYESMKADISRHFAVVLPARVHHGLLGSGYATIAELKQDFDENHAETVMTLVRTPGIGRTTLNQIMSALEVEEPKATGVVPDLNRKYVTSGASVLTVEDRNLLKRLITSHLSISPEGPVAEQLLEVRKKL